MTRSNKAKSKKIEKTTQSVLGKIEKALQIEKVKDGYEYNRVLISVLSKRIFFCPKVRRMEGNLRKVIGAKYDVTDDLQPYLLKKHRINP